MAPKASSHTGILRRTVTINAPAGRVWRKVSDIAGLPGWAAGVRETSLLSGKKSGVGAVRLITFDDGNEVEEHVVAWERGRSLTYVATEGLPLRAYVATISVAPAGEGSARLTWQSYLNSERMPARRFAEFLESMGSFYGESLENLKGALEGRPGSRRKRGAGGTAA